MGSELPEIERERFGERLAPAALSAGAIDRLYAHYAELRRWNPRLSLIGPGDRDRVVERHYGESLQALDWIAPQARTLVDIGSGGGFPGMVLAAARPDLEVYLVEPRQRKWVFLTSAAERAALSVRCLDARVGASLPEGLPERIDVVTLRALKLGEEMYRALGSRMPPGASLLHWQGAEEVPVAGGFSLSRRRRLTGSERRALVEWKRLPDLEPGRADHGS